MTLEQILADPNTFADTIEMPIGTEKITLGQLRSLSNSRQKELSDKIASATSQETVARDTAMKAANLLSELQTAKEKLIEQKTTPPTEDDFDKEEFWGPVRKRFSERDKKIEDAIKGLDALTKAVTQVSTIWAEDRWAGQFEKVSPRLKKVDQYKDWDYTKVRDYAVQNKILDKHGLPSVENAVMELTKATEIEQIKKEAYEEGKKAGQSRARLETMAKPASASGGRGVAKGKSAVAEYGFEGLGDDVMNDPELAEQIANLSSLDTLTQ